MTERRPPENKAAQSAAELSRQETASIQDQPFVPQRGVPAMGARQVRLFVSFDDEGDGKRAESLLAELQASFGASGRYEYEVWHQREIGVGENLHDEIAKRLAASDAVLLLLSKHRLSHGGQDVDLGALHASEKLLIPIALESLSKRLNLRGLEARRIFRSKRGSFSACQTSAQKEAFVGELFEEIEELLDRWFEKAETQPLRRDLARHGERYEDMARELMSSYERKDLKTFVGPSGAEASLAEDLDRGVPDRSEANAVVMLDALQQWVRDPAGTRYAAILGEYGMGKTTLLRKLTDELLRQRVSDPSLPLPIFIDLRYYSETIQKEARVPRNIEELLREALGRSWRSSTPEVEPEDILRLVREEGAILIFDGLDEKLVHLTEAQGQAFIRTLWQALPPRSSESRQAGVTETEPAAVSGRMIFSCRSHYFKTLRSQSALFLGEDREGLRSASYRAWVLLPFNEQQIRLYLANVLGQEHVEAAMELFGAVHNLRDLAKRPYLLSLITENIHALERRRMRGETVQGVTIYDLLVERWLKRDNGKHKLRSEDKLRLMEEVAGEMWSHGDRGWPWERLRDWLGARLARDDVFRTRYANLDSEVLEEDIRTATFVLRPDASEREFRFAHTSLLEFFLAKHLFRALSTGSVYPWNLTSRALPSPEAFDFLGQLIAIETDSRVREKCLATMSTLLGGDHPDAAGAAFRYWVMAVQRRLPEPRPLRVDLRGADLSKLVIRGRSAAERLNLSRADFSGARLVGSVWQDADLSGATLAGAQAERAEFHRVVAREIDVSQADLTGTGWRGCDARGLRGQDAEWYGCHWIDSLIDIGSLPQQFGRLGSVGSGPACPGGIPSFEVLGGLAQRPSLTTTLGHGGLVCACAWSPDGTQVLSGSDDHTLKVWDAATGEELLTLVGHRDGVRSCAWSPDGMLVVSGSCDKTLKVWDSRTGEELRKLEGHRGKVNSCAWSPNGTQVLSGSDDHSLKVWDAATGEELRTLVGHGEWVSSCAWSPDGMLVVSGSGDETMRVWNAGTGMELRTFEGHHSDVTACAWSPDGTNCFPALRTTR